MESTQDRFASSAARRNVFKYIFRFWDAGVARMTHTPLGCREFRRGHRLSRRQVLQAGSIAALGLGMGDLESRLAVAQATGSTLRAKPAKACIFLFMWGGPSQLETFDLKLMRSSDCSALRRAARATPPPPHPHARGSAASPSCTALARRSTATCICTPASPTVSSCRLLPGLRTTRRLRSWRPARSTRPTWPRSPSGCAAA